MYIGIYNALGIHANFRTKFLFLFCVYVGDHRSFNFYERVIVGYPSSAYSLIIQKQVHRKGKYAPPLF